jgi:hypothetical protein
MVERGAMGAAFSRLESMNGQRILSPFEIAAATNSLSWSLTRRARRQVRRDGRDSKKKILKMQGTTTVASESPQLDALRMGYSRGGSAESEDGAVQAPEPTIVAEPITRTTTASPAEGGREEGGRTRGAGWGPPTRGEELTSERKEYYKELIGMQELSVGDRVVAIGFGRHVRSILCGRCFRGFSGVAKLVSHLKFMHKGELAPHELESILSFAAEYSFREGAEPVFENAPIVRERSWFPPKLLPCELNVCEECLAVSVVHERRSEGLKCKHLGGVFRTNGFTEKTHRVPPILCDFELKTLPFVSRAFQRQRSVEAVAVPRPPTYTTLPEAGSGSRDIIVRDQRAGLAHRSSDGQVFVLTPNSAGTVEMAVEVPSASLADALKAIRQLPPIGRRSNQERDALERELCLSNLCEEKRRTLYQNGLAKVHPGEANPGLLRTARARCESIMDLCQLSLANTDSTTLRTLYLAPSIGTEYTVSGSIHFLSESSLKGYRAIFSRLVLFALRFYQDAPVIVPLLREAAAASDFDRLDALLVDLIYKAVVHPDVSFLVEFIGALNLAPENTVQRERNKDDDDDDVDDEIDVDESEISTARLCVRRASVVAHLLCKTKWICTAILVLRVRSLAFDAMASNERKVNPSSEVLEQAKQSHILRLLVKALNSAFRFSNESASTANSITTTFNADHTPLYHAGDHVVDGRTLGMARDVLSPLLFQELKRLACGETEAAEVDSWIENLKDESSGSFSFHADSFGQGVKQTGSSFKDVKKFGERAYARNKPLMEEVMRELIRLSLAMMYTRSSITFRVVDIQPLRLFSGACGNLFFGRDVHKRAVLQYSGDSNKNDRHARGQIDWFESRLLVFVRALAQSCVSGLVALFPKDERNKWLPVLNDCLANRIVALPSVRLPGVPFSDLLASQQEDTVELLSRGEITLALESLLCCARKS